MEGFFDLSEMVTESTDYLCSQCGLFRTCNHPRMEPTGNNRLNTLIVAEAPGEDEDNQGKQLVGEIGQFFRTVLEQRDLDLDEDFTKTNSLRCRPPGNEKPNRNQLASCYPHIEKLLREKKPKFVWLMGEAAIESYFMTRFSGLKASRWRGLCIPDFERKVWVICTYHPSFAKRNERDPLILSQYIRDLDFAINCIRTKPDLNAIKVPNMDNVRVVKDFDEICERLEEIYIHPPEYLFFDYESTGLKPHRAGHKIVSTSYCIDDQAISFPLERYWTDDQQKVVKKQWCKVLTTKSKKVAHNIPFEDVWSRVILNTTPVNWYWCTMITSHIIDNRQKYTSLKYQAFIHWGIPDYGKSMEPYKNFSDERGFNRMMDAPLNPMLLYGGTDSLILKWLFELQKPLLDEHLLMGQDLFTEGELTFADVQINGIYTDAEYYDRAHIELEQRIEQRKKELLEFKECKRFLEVMGREINLGSSDDLRHLFFNILKLEPSGKTEKGTPQVDATSLAKLDTPLAVEITALNKVKKIDGTYIAQFRKEIDDDHRIHPFFSLDHVRTYRGSSNKPNIQNVPIRDEEAKRFARSGIKPSPGWKILDFDYAANEVKTGACYTKDPTLVAYCKDPDSDMHKDTAIDIFCIPKDAHESYWKEKSTGKKLRFHTKNGFVFPTWYGSTYKNTGTNMWRECQNLKIPGGITVAQHLQNIGVIKKVSESLDYFVSHVKHVEQLYWEKFNMFKSWQEDHYRFYERHGYIELWTGFRCSGYMGKKELVNYLFQGTAFHWLLWSLNQINAEFHDRKMESKVIAQIHDNAIIDSPPDEKEEVISLCTEIATIRLREQYPWIIVPLVVEWEETEIDGSWYAKTDVIEEED